ncbi:Gfo/Idh/MocA family protein [Virgibacillus natechei]
MYFFRPQHDRVKEIIASDEIGEVNFLRSSFSFLLTDKKNSTRMNATKGGGTFYDIGCYSIHSIRNILEQEPLFVSAQAKFDPEYNIETDAVSYLEFADGITALIDNSFNLTPRNEYEVIGTKGRIRVPRAYRPDWTVVMD